MGRLPAIDDDEITVPFPVDIPEINVHDRVNFDSQIAMTKLRQIMRKIVKEVYSNKNAPIHRRVINTRAFEHLKKELEYWKTKLPEALRVIRISSKSVAHIHFPHEQAIGLLTSTGLNHAAVNQHCSIVCALASPKAGRDTGPVVTTITVILQGMSVLRSPTTKLNVATNSVRGQHLGRRAWQAWTSKTYPPDSDQPMARDRTSS
ncbi:hypothetical protein BJ878DRAFT_481586 [Calycina marina]|uniref:Xylanolytic transcriptional activator regulatory domain-containing protein n=1 Tax=Calycina marina TaxID=1763456 RepID=A0A9P8CDM9_9HELO|nr:hypothetical protein BJ878DRAFT_481586 [Calycina marina]